MLAKLCGTAIDGAKPGFDVTAIEDAIEAFSQAVNETALKELRNVWVVYVMPLAQWEANGPVPKRLSSW
jgi:hypothetical protein